MKPERKRLGVSNVFRHFCINEHQHSHREDEGDFKKHPSASKRIDRILMANPKIREQIGCASEQKGLQYCSPVGSFNKTRAVYVKPEVSDDDFTPKQGLEDGIESDSDSKTTEDHQ